MEWCVTNRKIDHSWSVCLTNESRLEVGVNDLQSSSTVKGISVDSTSNKLRIMDVENSLNNSLINCSVTSPTGERCSMAELRLIVYRLRKLILSHD